MKDDRSFWSADDYARFVERASLQDPEFAWEYLAARAAWESPTAPRSGGATGEATAAGGPAGLTGRRS